MNGVHPGEGRLARAALALSHNRSSALAGDIISDDTLLQQPQVRDNWWQELDTLPTLAEETKTGLASSTYILVSGHFSVFPGAKSGTP